MAYSDLAILWDMDGTIIDSSECHYFTWKETLRSLGFEIDREAYHENFGRNNQTLVPLLIGFEPDPEQLKKIIEKKEALYRKLAPEEASLITGVRSWLAEAENRHFHQAIASSAPMENIQAILDGFNLRQYFDAVVSGAELPAKPEPDVFINAARILDHEPESCLVIEDSMAGVAAAKNAGMYCVAVATGYAHSELHRADFVLDDFTHPLEDILSKIGLV